MKSKFLSVVNAYADLATALPVLSPRVTAILAVASVPLAWLLAVASAIIWDATGPQPSDAPAPFVAVSAWMQDHLPLLCDGQPVWGWRELFWVAPALALPAAFAVARAPFAARTGHAAALTMAWGLAAATVLVAGAYNFVGWPFDLVAILVATVAATLSGISALRHRTLPRSQAFALLFALPLMLPLALLAFGYPSPSVFLGLLLALTWRATAAVRTKPSRRRAPSAEAKAFP